MSTIDPNAAPTPAPAATPAATTTQPSTSPAPVVGGTPEPAAWAEYVPDPSKSDAENAALKADHDAKKPGAPTPKDPAEPAPLAVADLVIPQGFEVDEAQMGDFLSILNDKALSPKDRANKLVELQTKSLTQASEKASKAYEDEVTRQQTECRDDPELGGAKFDASAAAANRVVNKYGSPELANLIGSTIGNSIHLLRFLNRIEPILAKHDSEPAPPSQGGAPGAAATKTQAEILYPNQGKS